MTDLFPSLAGQGMIAVDVETCDPDLKTKGSGAHRGSFIAGVAVGTEAGFRGYYPIAHEAGENLPRDKVLGWLSEQLMLPVPKIGARLLYDLGFLHAAGVKPAGPFYDVQVAEPLLDENKFVYSLESIATAWLGTGKKDEELDAFLVQRFGRKNPKNYIWRAPANIVAPYAIGDVDLPLRIFPLQRRELEKQNLWDLFILESKLIPMLAAMRERGVRIDLARAERMRGELKAKQAELDRQITSAAGAPVAVWAAASIARAFDSLGIEYPLTPKTKKPSFTAPWLEDQDHPIANLIKDARKLDKLIGTFIEGSILEKHHEGRIHCNFNQLRSENGGAVSGRFSCVAPWTPVVTSHGNVRIDQVQIGDEVFTHRRRWRKVTATWVKGFEQMFDVHLTNGQIITCTGKHRVYIEELDREREEREESTGLVPDHVAARDRRRLRDDTPQCFRSIESLLDDERATSYVLVEPLEVEDGRQEPDEGKALRPAPQLEGTDQREGWLPDDLDARGTRSVSSLRDPAREGVPGSPHRRRPDEQRSGQPGHRHQQGTQHDPRDAEDRAKVVKIQKIEASRAHPVYDISVEEDESYLACGMFSHNSSGPNLQFIPVRTEDGKKIRSMFLPDEGQQWGKLDYSQIEYVLIIHDAVHLKLKGASEVADKYRGDESADFHKIVGDMTGLDRQRAKTINFGLAYGEGVDKLCRQLGLNREEGEALIREYHRRAPFMRPLAEGCRNMASAKGEISTLLHRRRRFNWWEIYDRKTKEKVFLRHYVRGSTRAFTHKALNARIQGSAADVMKKAMVDAWESGVCGVLGAPHLTVHDELDVSVPDTAAGREAIIELKRIMEQTVKLHVPLRVDMEVGRDWGATSKVTKLNDFVASAGRGGGFAEGM